MSEIKVNKISPRTNCGTTTLGDSGDTFTIPAGVTISNSGTASGFGSTGEVSWNTTKITADPGPAVSGVGYFTDTSSSAFNVTLPSSPSAGAVIAVADYANNWGTNNLTILRNGSNIEGSAENFVCNTNGATITFVYVDATKGWVCTNSGNSSEAFGPTFIQATGGTITECGNCKIHTFTGPGTFTVCQISSCAANNVVSYVVVAGGGSGGTQRGGGGGAGGYREVKSPVTPYTASPLDGYSSAPNRVTVTATAFPITVGGGGPSRASPNNLPNAQSPNGSPSTFSTITSAGGGFGGNNTPPSHINGGPGGSGGGAGGQSCASGGTGNTPPVSPAQGTNGGNDTRPGSPPGEGGGGGGGATVAGVNSVSANAGNGGAGATSCITGSPVTRAGGGGGGTTGSNPQVGSGGSGGGGEGGNAPPGSDGHAGTANTGGGGGGAGSTPGSSSSGGGGSGVVIIRYKFQ